MMISDVTDVVNKRFSFGFVYSLLHCVVETIHSTIFRLRLVRVTE